MERTALTVGGFTQPSVAKGLIELPASIEKGLSQRFLWLFPRPSFSMLESLEIVDENFCCYLGECKLVSIGAVVGMYMYMC
jgi:hypothetical protein